MNNNLKLIANINTVPVVTKKTIPQTVYPSAAYDDYNISSLYYPPYGMGVILIFIGLLVLILQFAFITGSIFLIFKRKKSIKCKGCGGTNFAQNGQFPEKCVYCGKKL